LRKWNRSHILLSVFITFAIVLILVLIPQVEALKIEMIEPGPKVLGGCMSFSIKITVEELELLPIQSVNMQIRNVENDAYSLSCEGLPLFEENKTYFTDGGILIVGARPEENWQYGYGYGYVSWENVGYYWGYGYGYGYGGIGPTSITYDVTWFSLPTWPSENYEVRVDVIADGTTFLKSMIVALESFLPPAEIIESISPPASIPTIIAGEENLVTVENVDIDNLSILTKENVENVRITIMQLTASPPALVENAPDIAYRYLTIIAENIIDPWTENVRISFRVEKTWVASQDIDKDTVTLYRYRCDPLAVGWQSLPTTRSGEDDTYFYYLATSPGLSVFAITGERVTPPPPPPPPVRYGVSVSISPSYLSGLAGASLTYTVIVTNTGNVSDIYSLTATDNAGWSPSVSPVSLSLAAGESRTAILSVTIPENAENCTRDNIIVTATSQSDSTIKDNSSCIAHAWFGYKVGVSISPSENSGAPGATLTFTVTVTNSGTFVDNYDLTASDNVGWKPTLSENSLKDVQPNENRTATLSVTIPENAENCTRDNIIVTATSRTDITVSDSGTCVAHAKVVLPAARFELSNLIISPVEVWVGDPVAISVEVTNVGDLMGDYRVILKIDGAIEATQTVTVDPGASETVTFTVVRVEAKTYDVEVDGLFGSFTVLSPPPRAWLVMFLAIIAVVSVALILLKKKLGRPAKRSEEKKLRKYSEEVKKGIRQ